MLDNSERERCDRELFDKVAVAYCSKDLLPSASCARRWRLQQTIAQIPLQRIGRLLEAGCGAGFSARYLEGHYDFYHGFDYSEQLVALAKEVNGAYNRSFSVGNARLIDFKETYDVLVMIGVLHHMADPGEALKNLRRALKPGAWVAINEPMRGNPLISAARAFRQYLDPDYSEEQDQYTATELAALLTSAGLESVKVLPQGVFSTPFAEVKMSFQNVAEPVARYACELDGWLESRFSQSLRWLSWNLIGVGREPSPSRSTIGVKPAQDRTKN